jgi:cellulose biosynthesis protein BcsQ
MTYDDALQELLKITLRGLPTEGGPRRVVVVRDVVGQLRLCVDGVAPAGLAQHLADGLQGWFAQPLLCTEAGISEERYAAEGVVELAIGASWPKEWPKAPSPSVEDPEPRGIDTSVWCALVPAVAKASWFRGRPVPAPVSARRRSVVVGFHSFKGGVGRTTAAAVLAYCAAESGSRVVLVDLDLEAPGLHHVFGVSRNSAGVLDAILAHQATGSLGTIVPQETLQIAGKGRIDVLHAGAESPTYLERLGHLDFASSPGSGASHASRALQALLKKLCSSRGTSPEDVPDLVIVDARAGLHDLGAIALRDLAHVNVLVARANEQGVEGLRQTLELLNTDDPATQSPLLILQTFAPADSQVRATAVHEFQARVEEVFAKFRWFSDEDQPSSDQDSPLRPFPIPVLADGSPGERLDEFIENQLIQPFKPAWARLHELIEGVRS